MINSIFIHTFDDNKREYNSERRRKLIIIASAFAFSTYGIRENITPRGDGNCIISYNFTQASYFLIRENITPRGDGNIYPIYWW